MAKRKRKSNTKVALSLLEIILAIAAICMLFVPVIGVKDSDTTFTGMQAAFGYTLSNKKGSLDLSYHVLAFSFMAFLPYLLSIISVVLIVVSLVLKNGYKLVKFLVALVFIASAVFFFLTTNFVTGADDLTSYLASNTTFTLGVGAIVAGVVSAVGALCALADTYLNK